MDRGKNIEVDISRTAGNVYEKFDRSNWMVIPKSSKVPKTSFLDVLNLCVVDDELTSRNEEVDILSILREGIKRIN